MQLLVFVTAALLASTSASPYRFPLPLPPTPYLHLRYLLPLPPTATPYQWGDPAAFCECINPFQGTINAYRGDPDSLCGGPGFCYVACNNACSDQMQTASAARCQSNLACDVAGGEGVLGTDWMTG